MSTQNVLTLVEQLLEEEELDGVRLEDSDAIRTGLQGEFGEWYCDIEVLPLSEHISVLGILSYMMWEVAPEHHAAAFQLINRINSESVLVGNFEMDEADGQVRYRTSLPFEDSAEVTLQSLRHLVLLNWTVVDHHMPLFTACLVDGDALDVAWDGWISAMGDDGDDEGGEEE